VGTRDPETRSLRGPSGFEDTTAPACGDFEDPLWPRVGGLRTRVGHIMVNDFLRAILNSFGFLKREYLRSRHCYQRMNMPWLTPAVLRPSN